VGIDHVLGVRREAEMDGLENLKIAVKSHPLRRRNEFPDEVPDLDWFNRPRNPKIPILTASISARKERV
jgi:hypothetical protein